MPAARPFPPLDPEQAARAASCVRLARRLAFRAAVGPLRRHGDALESEALWQLVRAAADFDPARGNAFSTVAHVYVRNGLRSVASKMVPIWDRHEPLPAGFDRPAR